MQFETTEDERRQYEKDMRDAGIPASRLDVRRLEAVLLEILAILRKST